MIEDTAPTEKAARGPLDTLAVEGPSRPQPLQPHALESAPEKAPELPMGQMAPSDRIGAAPAPAPLPAAIGFDTNTRLTLLFLVVVTVVATAAWGTAHFFCNYNPVYSQEFTPVEFERRVDRPKNAGLEFHHRLFVQDYDLASEIALERGVDILEERRAACDEACRAQRTARQQRARTRALLHRVRGMEAWVTAETFFDGQVDSETYLLRRVGRRWLVVGRDVPPG